MIRWTALATLVAAMSLPVITLPVATGSARADDHGVQTRATQQAMTPQQAFERLQAGNRRFVSGQMLERDLPAQVAQTATGQHPFAVVLGCIDSRVPPELVFDQGIGDVFSARIAGNFVNTDILGSLEFATAVAGARLVVVLGHSECGAVKGACDHVELGNLTHTLASLAPAVYAVKDVEGPRSSKNPAFVSAVAHANVAMTVQNVLERSRILRDQSEAGELRVVGAMHDVATGVVTWLD